MPAEPGSRTLRWAVVLLAIQTVGLVAIVGWLSYADLASPSQSTASAVGLTVFVALWAALLGGLAWALWRLRSWARGPAIVLELLLVPIGYSMASNGLPWVGVPVLLLGLTGAGLLLAPSTRAALGLR
jgi:hypothetical protein